MNEMGMFEIEEQHFACQVHSIFKNNLVTETGIQQLRKEIEKDEIAPERVYRGSSGTETVREQACDLDDYPGGTPEDYIETSIHLV